MAECSVFFVDAGREITIQGAENMHLRVLQSTCGTRSKAEVFARTGTGASDSRLRTLRLAFITKHPDKGFWNLSASIKGDGRQIYPKEHRAFETIQQTARLLCQMLAGRFDIDIDPRAISRVVSALYVAESMETQEDVDRCVEALRSSLELGERDRKKADGSVLFADAFREVRDLDALRLAMRPLCGGCGQETTACTGVYKACVGREKNYVEGMPSPWPQPDGIKHTKEFRLRPYKSPVMLAVDDQSEPP